MRLNEKCQVKNCQKAITLTRCYLYVHTHTYWRNHFVYKAFVWLRVGHKLWISIVLFFTLAQNARRKKQMV